MSTTIHPSAVVNPKAEIDEGCTIGPYCVIGPEVKLGPGTILHSHVVIDGRIRLGERCEIYPFACLGQKTQDLKYKGGMGEVCIGRGNVFREYVTVHQPTSPDGITRIGNDNNLLAYCHIAHDCTLGNGIIMSNATNIAGHVVIEDAAIFGGLTGIHQFVRVGSMAMIGACSKIVQDIVPYTLNDGNPATPHTINKIGLQRRGVDDATIRALTRAYRIFFRAGLPQAEALAQIRAELPDLPQIRHFVDFIATSQRGIARPSRKTREETND